VRDKRAGSGPGFVTIGVSYELEKNEGTFKDLCSEEKTTRGRKRMKNQSKGEGKAAGFAAYVETMILKLGVKIHEKKENRGEAVLGRG